MAIGDPEPQRFCPTCGRAYGPMYFATSPRDPPALCPVCVGRGDVGGNCDSTSANRVTCHGCGGKGWV